MSDAITELRPKRSSFLFQRIVPGTVALLVVMSIAATALSTFGPPGSAALPFALWLVLVAIMVRAAFVAYRKERYEVGATRMVAHRGGLLSDQLTDLEFRNVTHVKQHLPWLRYRFFDVGDVLVESAGSSSSEVVFRSVRNPDAVYAMIRERLQANGYALRQQTLLHEERPDPTGVALEVVGTVIGAVVALIWFAGTLVVDAAGSLDGVGALVGRFTGDHPGFAHLLVYVLPIIAVVWALAMAVLRFLDLRRRTYRVYDDVVVYEEGFLNRNNAFIPYENIADADVVRTLLDRVLDLADVRISCQGGASEVRFRRLKRAEALSRTVSKLVAAAEDRAHDDPVPGSAAEPGAAPTPIRRARGIPRIAPEDVWTAEFKPEPVRAAMTTIALLPLFPIWALTAVIAWLQSSATTFRVTRDAISIASGVLGTTERTYAYDKITGVSVRSSPLDRWMNTLHVQVWSIGSNMPLDIAHVRRDAIDVPRLLRQLGIPASPALRELPTTFGPGVWLRSSPSVIVWSLLWLIAASLLVAVTGEVLLAGVLLVPMTLAAASYAFGERWTAAQRCSFHEHHVELQSGLWWRQHTYARYDNIKKVEVTRYPGSDAGQLKLYVAGERLVQNNNNKGNATPVPYSVAAARLANVRELGRWVDELIAGRRGAVDTRAPSAAPPRWQAQPVVATVATRVALVSLLLLPISLITVPLSIWRARVRVYRLDDLRVIRAEGRIWRRESSVLLDRIDSLQRTQGPLGKAFGNGNVTVFTAGSSRPDLQLTDLKTYNEVYSALRDASAAD